MNLRNLASKTLAPLVLACGIAPSCGNEPSVPQLSPEQIIEYIEGAYEVDVDGKFSPKVLDALKNTLEKTESTYPGLLPKLNVRIRGVPLSSLLEHGCLGLTGPIDLMGIKEDARGAKSGFERILKELEAGREVSPEEFEQALNRSKNFLEDIKKGSFEGVTVNLPETAPASAIEIKGITLEELVGHELGHAVFQKTKAIYYEVENAFQKVTPSQRENIIQAYPSAEQFPILGELALDSMVGLMVEVNEAKHYSPEILRKGYVSNHPLLADHQGAMKHVLESRYIPITSGSTKTLLTDLAGAINGGGYGQEGDGTSEDLATFFAYTIIPRDLKGDFPKVKSKADFMKAKIREVYKPK